MDTAAKAADMFHSIVEVVDVGPKKWLQCKMCKLPSLRSTTCHDMFKHVQKLLGKRHEKGMKKA